MASSAVPVPTEYTIYNDEETKSWDYLTARNLKRHTTVIESMGHLIKGCLGAGMLGIHQAFMKAGIWTALVMNVFFGVYLSYCILILVRSAQRLYYRLHIPALSYSDLAEVSLASSSFVNLRKYSGFFRKLVDIVICLDLFGACCCYEIYIGETIKQLIENRPEGKTDMYAYGNSPNLRVYIIIIAIPILIICLIRGLKFLAPFSLVADGLILMSVATTVYYSATIAPPLSERPAWKSFHGLAEFAGVSVFSMEGVGVSMAIENNMADPNKFPVVLFGGMGFVVSVVTLTGFMGYWGWGEDCESSVTLNFPMTVFPEIVKVSMAVVITITFALNFWVPFNIVWYYLGKRFAQNKHWIWERVFRVIHVLCITVIAAAFPKLGNFMGFIGSLCLSNMGFIFPAFIELVVIWEKPGLGRGKWRLWRNLFIIVLGLSFMCFGTWVNGRELFGSSEPATNDAPEPSTKDIYME